MLVTLKPVLAAAEAGSFAVGAFNTSNMLFTQAIIEAANELKAPVIVQTSEGALDFAGSLDLLAQMVGVCAEATTVPIVFHLDHGKHPKLVHEVMRHGYTSVMFDGSMRSLHDNTEETKVLAKLAHAQGLSIEGEIGHVGGREDNVHAKVLLTDPEQAAHFVAATNIDALAVAFGNAHGKPTAREELHFDVLNRVRELVKIPLVFHGASSTPEADVKRAIKAGVRKINIDTDLRIAATTAIRTYLKKHPDSDDPREYFSAARDAVTDVVKHKIRLFGSAGMAKHVKT